jgi:predicted Zn finger-like uncharacterized protein
VVQSGPNRISGFYDFNMMISCPTCHARYSLADDRPRDQGLALCCSACGHNWVEPPVVESRAIEIYDVTPRQLPPPSSSRNLPAVIEPGPDADVEVRRLVEASRLAREAFKEKRAKRMKRLRGWAILGTLALSPIAAAAAFPVQVVKIAPATIRVYELAGLSVNIYGLEIRRLEQQHAIVDGTRVLTVKGEVTNITSSERKIPWLRFGLADGASQEVYHWTLDTNARPLRPGETTSFITRIASPPESAKKLKIRFAHADEIGSKP